MIAYPYSLPPVSGQLSRVGGERPRGFPPRRDGWGKGDESKTEVLTTSIQLTNKYKMDDAIQLISILSDVEDDLDDSLISLGSCDSANEFTKDHFQMVR